MSLKDELILLAQKIEIQILDLQIAIEMLDRRDAEDEKELLLYKLDSIYNVWSEIQYLVSKYERGLLQ